ncbi:hypothetical protein ACOACO_18455 [Nocardioides sp. CPCC 205120]|uniref:hypothetical protein n=1 Tax=Nocardioides sp. CPCC 205120 TaxID=3406462 RepID=UPI003B5153B4
MTTSWFTVKYVADLMRDEPRNVGLVVKQDDETVTKFLGERADGTIDGRNIGRINSVETYKLWVDHWRRVATTQSCEELEAIRVRPGDNYFLSPRMERVFGSDVDLGDLAGDLFASLVAEDREEVVSLKDQVEGVFKHLALDTSVEIDKEIQVQVEGDTFDTLHFDYLYRADSRERLMERVNLATADRRTWDKVHAASWTFTRLLEGSARDDARDVGCIALVRTGSTDRDQQLKQMRLLERTSEVVDFASTSSAERKLADLLVPA